MTTIVQPIIKNIVQDLIFSDDVGFLPTDLDGLIAWYRFNLGITTIGNGSISIWADQSGNGNDLFQDTMPWRPSEESDGSVLFDGDDDYLITDPFPLVQPTTVFTLFQFLSHTQFDKLHDGIALASGVVHQINPSPNTLASFAGFGSPGISSLALNNYGISTAVFNGVSGIFQINNGMSVTGDFGARDMGGFLLGAQANIAQFGNCQIKESAVFNVASTPEERTSMKNYLDQVGGGGIL